MWQARTLYRCGQIDMLCRGPRWWVSLCARLYLLWYPHRVVRVDPV